MSRFAVAVALVVAAAAAAPATRAAEPAPRKAAERVVEHRVKRYENLHLLAAYYLLDARRWPEIAERNRDVIADPNLLVPGAVLKIAVPADWKPPFDLDAYVATYLAPEG